MRAADLARAIPRPVVDEDDLVVRIRQLIERTQIVLERLRRVVRAHDDGNPRPGPLLLARERRVRKGGRHRARGRLWPALGVYQTELPVVDRMSTAPPFVGPGESHRAA